MPEPKEPTAGRSIARKVEKPESQDTVDTSWVDLAEGRIGQVSQVEMAQSAQVQAAADKKKASAVLKKLQSVPEATVLKKDEAAINKERELFGKEFQSRADERNKNRKWYEKLLGKNKLTVVDIAQDEASRVNKLIQPIEKDELVKGERDVLASELVERAEFGHKDVKTIGEEEMVRKYAPDLVKALEEGNFAQAKKEERKLNGIKGDERWSAERGTRKLLNQRVEALVSSGDAERMREFVQVYSLNEMGLETLAKLPQEVIREAVVQGKLVSNLNTFFNLGKYEGPAEAVKRAQTFTQLGLMKQEDVAKLFASPEYQEHLKDNLNAFFNLGKYEGPAEAVKRAQEFVDLKLMTPEAVAKIFAAPEYQKFLQENIAVFFNLGKYEGPAEAVKRAQEFVRLGYMTKQRVDAVIAELKLKFGKR